MARSYLTSGRASVDAPAASPAGLVAVLLAAMLLVVSASCEKEATASSSQIASISISPTSLALTPGTSRPLVAQVLDQSGAPLSAQVFWAAEDSRIATVTSQGVVTALAPGRTQVAASKSGISAVVAVTVSALPATLLRVNPTTSTINIGATTTFTAEVLDASGRPMNGQSVAWSSGNTGVATVNSNGVVTGTAAGTAIIAAAAAGLSGTAVVAVQQTVVSTVTVTPSSPTIKVARTVQLTATVRDARGNVVTGRSITWSSSNLLTATVLPTGLVTGLTKGTVTIRATCEGKTGSATVKVE